MDPPQFEPSETDIFVSIALRGGHQIDGRLTKRDFEDLVHRLSMSAPRPLQCTILLYDNEIPMKSFPQIYRPDPSDYRLPFLIILVPQAIAGIAYAPLSPALG